MYNLRLGVAIETVTHHWTDDLPELLAAAGVATVEVTPRFARASGLTPATFAQRLRACGVEISSVHAPFGADIDLSSLDTMITQQGFTTVRDSIALAAQLGALLVVVHASYEPIPDHERADRLVQAHQQINALALLAADQHSGLAIELLPRTCLGNRVGELLLLASALGPTSGGVCLDTNHGMDRYCELPKDIERLRPALRALHISDYDGVDEQHQLPGTGVVDWAACLSSLREINYRGPFTYECALADATPQERLHTLAANFAWITQELNR